MTIVAAMLIAHGVVTAQVPRVEPLGFDIVGTWDLQVAFVDCSTGTPLGQPGRSLVTYAQGGTYIEEAAGIPPSRRYPGLGVWRHLRARTYALAFKAFQYNADGTSNGKMIVTAETEHNLDDTLTSAAVARIYNASGILIVTGCVNVTGTRFTGEQ
jgi:hypothetical protein